MNPDNQGTSSQTQTNANPQVDAFSTPSGMNLAKPQKNSARRVLVILVALIILTAAVSIFLLVSPLKKSPQPAAKTPEPVLTYNDIQVKALAQANQLTPAALAKLDKTNTFYSAFRAAAQQPIVQTTWDVYDTKNQADARATPYSITSMSVDYRSKQYTYDQDDHTSAGVTVSRCDGNAQKTSHYIFDAAASTARAKVWRPADKTTCAFAAAAARMSDGMNTGGLSVAQSDALVHSLFAQRALTIDSATLVTQAGTPYMKFDVSLTPQRKAAPTYTGMQAFLDAFQATGLNAAAHPYGYFGTSSEGMHLQYYVDPLTMLPRYSVAVSTPQFDASGKQIAPSSWSHRYVEYLFPSKVKDAIEDDHLLTFSNWPDH